MNNTIEFNEWRLSPTQYVKQVITKSEEGNL